MKWISTKSVHASRKLGLLPPPLAGEGWGGGGLARIFACAPSLPLQPKSDVSDFGQLIKRPNSGKPEVGCKRGRGRCGPRFRNLKTDFCCTLLLLALAAAGAARAQEPYPTRPLRLVVGFGAGGPTDIPARFVADKLGEALGQRVIVENKPAAAGMIATRDVLSQPRDGYTLLLCTHFDPINTVLYKNAQFRLSDLAPVSLIAKYYYGLALANAVPADDFKAFVQYAKAHPGEVTYATIGAGSAQEILARQLEKLTGIAMNRIPFRGGPQVVQELVAGRVDFYVSPTLAIVPQYQAKQLKILAVTAPERLKSLSDIPTLIESGVDFVRFGWLGVCAGAGTPQPILALLQRQIATIVASPDYREMIEKAGSIAVSSTADEFQQVIAQTVDGLASSIREFGLQQEQ
jgi:tripartite-type tricarboxylate transporter receptor subunit TctC